MKRRNFILTTLTSPVLASNQLMENTPINSGFKVTSGEGRFHGHIKLKGVNENILDLKVSGKDNNGAFSIFEQISLSPKKGTPLHLHYKQDEFFHVLEGEYMFLVGEEKFSLKKGDTIFLPKKVPHAWSQLSDLGKMMVVFQPAGKMEEFFLQVASLKAPPTKDELSRIFEENEMKVVGPPLNIE